MLIKDLIKKPSQALEIMIQGIEHHTKRDDFELFMNSFGGVEWKDESKVICHGCAATCAVQQIAKKDFKPEESYNVSSRTRRAIFLGFDSEEELMSFEYSIDQAARLGQLSVLFDFCEMYYYTFLWEIIKGQINFKGFSTLNEYKEQLPELRKVIELMKKHDL